MVVAAFNEGPAIRPVMEQLTAAGWRVVVVDDGSRDVPRPLRDPGVVVLRHAINRGQGAALQTGIDFAVARGAKHVVTFDADGQHDPADLDAMVAALDGADVALGSRFLGPIEGAIAGAARCYESRPRVEPDVAHPVVRCALRAARVSCVGGTGAADLAESHGARIGVAAQLRLSGLHGSRSR